LSRKRLLLIILLPASILVAVWLVGVAVRGGSQDQDGPQSSGTGPGGQGSRSSAAGHAPTPVERASRLAGDLQDLMARHPDYDLTEARIALRELLELPARPRTKILDELEARVAAVEVHLRAEATGLNPTMEGWDETLRFKSFSPNGFRDFFERTASPETASPATAPPITGEPVVDRRIVELAVARGYRLRSQADESRLESEGRHSLQPEVFAAWRALQIAARGDGVELELVSAYRSIERQREIFRRTLEQAGIDRQGRGPSVEDLRSGRADDLIEAVLRESSPPGYSKHHSGYTIDITDAASGLEFTDFGRTAGFAWISRRNFLNAKRFGFLPSYPLGADSQGPDPEPWEYVWVGTAALESHPDTPEPGSPVHSEP
jgi:D-alanyl-D-alanine carboxypeptidase